MQQAKAFDIAGLRDRKILSVQVRMPGLGEQLIYMRHFFYALLHDVLQATDPSISGRNALICGTPGIGKSTFGVILVLVAVKAGKPCAYWNQQWGRGFIITATSTLLFTDIKALNAAAVSCGFSTGALYIVDTEKPIMFGEAQVVVITSPRFEVWKEFVKCPRRTQYPFTLTMPTFELAELESLVSLGCVHPGGRDWRQAYELYGGVPRHVFDPACTMELWLTGIAKAADMALQTYKQLNAGPAAEVSGKEGGEVPDKCLHFHTKGQTAAGALAAAAVEPPAAPKARAAEPAAAVATLGGAAGGAAAAETGSTEEHESKDEDEETAAGEDEETAADDAAVPPLHAGQPEYYAFDGLVYASKRTEAQLAATLVKERKDDMLRLLGQSGSLHYLAPVLGPIFERMTLQGLVDGEALGWEYLN